MERPQSTLIHSHLLICLSLISLDTLLLLPEPVGGLDERKQIRLVVGLPLILSFRYSLAFAARGANVVVNDVSKENAERVVEEIRKGEFVYR